MRITADQQKTLDDVVTLLSKDESVNGIVFGGSIPHGFSDSRSDIDILIVVSEQERLRRHESGEINYYNDEIACYEGGYVDGKFISREFISLVAEKGSEPARFAFCDSIAVFDRLGGLDTLIKQAGRYPVEHKADRIRRFLAQLEGWGWYYEQGCAKESAYLCGFAAYKTVMFAGRLLLAVNETLYPYHKWLFRVAKNVPIQPKYYLQLMEQISDSPNLEDVNRLVALGKELAGDLAAKNGWGGDFLRDVELTWLDDKACIEEI